MRNLKKLLCLILASSAFVTVIPYAVANTAVTETIDTPTICTWPENKTAAVSITIDDGIYDSAVRYNELQKKYGIHSTQFMIPGRLEGADMATINGWRRIFEEGYMDLGNHSYSHKLKYNTDEYTSAELVQDITTAQQTLRLTFKGNKVFSFATPWGQTPDNVVEEIKKKHYANRAASGGIVPRSTPSDFFRIPAVAVKYGTTIEKLNGHVDSAVEKGGWYVALLHQLGEEGTDDGAYLSKYETIEEHFKYIKTQSDNGDVWSGSFNDVVRYIYERDSAKAETEIIDAKTLKISLTDEMEDNSIFNYPLTMKVNVPLNWPEKATLKYNKNTNDVKIIEENGKKYAYINIVPDTEKAELSVNELLEIAEKKEKPEEIPQRDYIAIYLDGEEIKFDIEPLIINGRTMVPMRAVFEKLGSTVEWDGETRSVISVKDNTKIKLTIDENIIYVNDVAKTLDCSALLIDSRTYVPVRAVSEAFGYEVGWDGETRTVLIKTV